MNGSYFLCKASFQTLLGVLLSGPLQILNFIFFEFFLCLSPWGAQELYIIFPEDFEQSTAMQKKNWLLTKFIQATTKYNDSRHN